MKNIKKSFAEIQSGLVKQPTTIEEQIDILKTRGILINNEKYTYQFLSTYNYYFITGYLHPYKINKDNYKNIDFSIIINQIKFDMRLKEICMYGLGLIEKSLRTIIAYHFSHIYNYGNIAYYYSEFFPGKEKEHEKLISYYKKNLENNKELLFIKHNIDHYGILPTWAAIELFTMGNLENFFKILNNDCIKAIEKTLGFPKNKISNWIESLRIFRNMVAHNQRLYNFTIASSPIKAKEYKESSGKIFDYVVVMKYLFKDAEDWNTYFIPRLEYVFEDFKGIIDLKCIGFPENWKDILTKK